MVADLLTINPLLHYIHNKKIKFKELEIPPHVMLSFGILQFL